MTQDTPLHFPVSLSRRVLLTVVLLTTSGRVAAQSPTEQQVRQSLDRAITAYAQIAVHGGYVYYYSPDLTRRLGEGVASPTQIWVQPPGTPAVGRALLRAWEATGEDRYRTLANEAATALIYGQLQSGGWTNSIDFDPDGNTAAYRNGHGRGRNFSTLDDDISQSALQFLMKCDQANDFQQAEISAAAKFALAALLRAQFANGGFPQGWDGPVADRRTFVKASFPNYDWRTQGRIKEYWDQYTLNDGLAGTVVETLLVADDVYDRADCRAALARFGDFLIMAQLPEPQPVWAQQYNENMQPIWARRFEPPAVAGRESEDVLMTLMRIYEVTREPRYLAPVPSAIAWFARSELPDGRMARYYELQTNRPLYMKRTSGRNYELTYDDSDLPAHYGWKNSSKVKPLRREYLRVSRGEPAATRSVATERIREILASQDDSGRWVSVYEGQSLVGQPKFATGERFLSSAVFCQNVEDLARWLDQSR